MRLHVIFGFEDTPEGKKINYQVPLNCTADVPCPEQVVRTFSMLSL